MLSFNPFKSLTMWGTVGSAVTWLSQQPKIGAAEILQAVMVVVTAFGARNAIAKASA